MSENFSNSIHLKMFSYFDPKLIKSFPLNVNTNILAVIAFKCNCSTIEHDTRRVCSCFLDDNNTDTTCDKGKLEQRRLVKVI